jgi:hypothetical protein
MLGPLQAERIGLPLIQVDNVQEREPETGSGKDYENDNDNLS